jgi:hypothetical protein
MINIDVHKTHCCSIHGCKYGQDDICPVVQGIVKQKYPCEDCSFEGDQINEMTLKELMIEEQELVQGLKFIVKRKKDLKNERSKG